MDISKPFLLVYDDLHLQCVPEEGGYSLIATNRQGVYSQGGTLEEALDNVLCCAREMEEFRALRAAEEASQRASKKKPRGNASKSPRLAARASSRRRSPLLTGS